MDTQQKRILLEEIGGEPLEGSGFESEQPSIEDDPLIRVPADHQKGEES